MVKKVKLDEKDYLVLQELDVDCRQTESKIAEKIGAQRTTINYKIKALEKSGIVVFYRPLVDFFKIGWNVLEVYIDLLEYYIEKIDDLIQFLVEKENIIEVSRTFGKYDLVIKIVGENLDEVYSTFKEIIRNFKDTIREYNTFMPLDQHYFSRDYLSKETAKRESWRITLNEPIKYDNIDKKIILLLHKNAREKVVMLAKEAKLTAPALLHRLAALERKKVILAYRAVLNIEFFDYEKYRVFLDIEKKEDFEKIIGFLKANENIVYVGEGIGPFDIVFDIEVDDTEILFNVLSTLKRTYEHAIRDYKYLKFIKLIK